MDKMSLNDIFSDPLFTELTNELPKKSTSKIDPDIEKFKEINEWIKNNNGNEPIKSKDLTERKLFSRLKGYREKPEMIKKFASIDEYNLLDKDSLLISDDSFADEKTESLTLDDILKDDSLLTKSSKEESLLDLSRYKRTIKASTKYSVRKRASHFEKYEPLFKLVHKEIANGSRKIVAVDTENNIKPGKFYIDNGILLYVVSMSDYYEDKNGYKNAKLHLVYENGTENRNIKLRSFASNLFDRTRHGRMVTEIISDIIGESSLENRAYNQITTGYIYVVKSVGNNPNINKYDNLYKIGYTSNDVKKRIANSENESTYLYAPVKIVATWEVQNVSAQKLETLLHQKFKDNQLQVSILASNGKTITPKEWYVISLEQIETTINEVIMKLNIV